MALKDVLGQQRPIEILKRSLRINRISHAYIFVGEEGVGKFFTAINLAKALNCETAADACDSCPSCIDIDKGIHPDVLIIKPEGDQIKIDQIRRAEERLAFSVLRGRKKILIIDKAHTMNISSANALLKTLEEPSEGTVIILITSAPNLLPATVLSRCQRLPFGLPSRKVVEEMLISKGFKEEEALLTASLSDGRIGNALKTNQEMLKERENFLTLFNSVKEPFYKISPTVEGIAKSEEGDLEEILWWGEVWLRDLVVFKVTGDPHLLINQDTKKEIEEVAERFSLYQLQSLFNIIHNTKRFITLRANRQLALEVMMIRLAETFTEV
jgi:DNA polymerase-3 subunit delta'